MKKSTFLRSLVLIFSLSLVIVSCSNYNVLEYKGFSAKITSIRIAKHGLKVIDIFVENKSNQKVEIKTFAMGSNGALYGAFDKKSYDKPGENTSLGLRKVFLNPNDQLALTWKPVTSREDDPTDVEWLMISIDKGGIEKSLILN